MQSITGALSKVTSGLLVPCGTRDLAGVARKVTTVLAIVIGIYHLWAFTIGTYDVYLHRVTHVGTILALSFLTYSFAGKPTKLGIVDILLAILSLAVMGYLLLNGLRLVWDRFALFPGSLTAFEIVLGVVLVIMVFEVSRRAIGSVLGLIAVTALLYTYFGPYFGGMWRHGGFLFYQIVDFTVFSMDGLFTIPIGVSSTYIILFLIFAGLIQVSGAGRFFTDMALALAGKARGGPAKVAVIGSGFMGSISGSAAANVAVTGSVTIPMMKDVGYKPYFAAAVEAAASTGGHIMPPIMGGVLFIMTELAGIRYWELVLIAFVPAILYYLGIFVQVHAYSVKHGIGRVDTRVVALPSVGQTLKNGWQHMLPFIAIVGLLASGASPIRAALWSMPVVIAVSWFRKDTRIGIKEILKAIGNGVMTTRLIMVATGLSGMLMGAVFYTGVGSSLVAIIRNLTGEMLLPALFLAAAMCLFFGLALSSVASYLLTAILIVPAAVSLGVPIVAAHLFAVYFASVAVITPPTGGVFFQAAAMAGAPPYKTGWQATRLAFAAFTVPFVWVYRPGLLLDGTPLEIVAAIVTGVIAVIVVALVIEGFFVKVLHILERGLLAVGIFGFIFGTPVQIAAGAGLVAVVLLIHWLRAKRLARVTAT